MKIQKQLSKKTPNKTYYKWVIVIPDKVFKKAGFKEGQELKAEARKGKVVLEAS